MRAPWRTADSDCDPECRDGSLRTDGGESRIDQRKKELQDEGMTRRQLLTYGLGAAGVAGGGWLVYDRFLSGSPTDPIEAYYGAFGESESASDQIHSSSPRKKLPAFIASQYGSRSVTVEEATTKTRSDGKATVDVSLSIDGIQGTRSGPIEVRTENGNWRLWVGHAQILLPGPQKAVFTYYDELNRGNKQAALAVVHPDSSGGNIPDTVVKFYEQNDVQVANLRTLDRSKSEATVVAVINGANSNREQQTVTLQVKTDDGEWKIVL